MLVIGPLQHYVYYIYGYCCMVNVVKYVALVSFLIHSSLYYCMARLKLLVLWFILKCPLTCHFSRNSPTHIALHSHFNTFHNLSSTFLEMQVYFFSNINVFIQGVRNQTGLKFHITWMFLKLENIYFSQTSSVFSFTLPSNCVLMLSLASHYN